MPSNTTAPVAFELLELTVEKYAGELALGDVDSGCVKEGWEGDDDKK